MLGSATAAGYPLERIWSRLTGNIDWTLLLIASTILALGTVTLYSASYENPARIQAQMVNIAVALGVMWVAAQVPPQLLMRLAVPIYLVGLSPARS